MKTCTKCNITKAISEFNKNKNSKDGHRSACKACMKKYREKNFEKIKTQKEAWRKNNLEHVKKQKQEYNKANQKKIKASKHKWYIENPDKVKASYERRLKKLRSGEAVNTWALKNPDKVREIKRNYKHKRRQQEKNGSITTAELKNWLDATYKICSYCGTVCSDNYHIDHIEPLSKGGKHELDNLTISCCSCNLRKSTKSLLEFVVSSNRN